MPRKNTESKARVEVRLANPRGFCAGVDRAIEIVEKALEVHGAPVYVLHEIVHNRHVLEDLSARGVLFVEELDEIPSGSVTVYSAHGPMPDTIADNTTVWPVGTEYVSFGANGFPRTIAGQGQPKTDFQLCDHRGNHDTGGGRAAGRWVQITTTGRPQIYNDQNYIQGARNPLNGC